MIVEDFNKIRAFLRLSDDWSLEIRGDLSESYCYRDNKRVQLGIERHYNRTVLVHECLHAVGYNHNGKNFSGVMAYYKASPMFERWIFS